MKLKLKEVLWEVTNKCNRNCSFCGSKGVMNQGDDATAIDRETIAAEIAKNADRVTLTGGEPLLIKGEFILLKDIFSKHNCDMDIVTNGDLIYPGMDRIFENIGISVNSMADVEKLKSKFDIINNLDANVVFIMNVNKINFFNLDEILTAVNEQILNLKFQFQLTMYKGENELMIDGIGIDNLRREIRFICNQHNIEYVFADNLQAEHECSAGISSCGIQYNGDVVYCLSERSWLTTDRVQGNVFYVTLKEIWQTMFKENRFEDNFECCRSCFKYTKCHELDIKENEQTAEKEEDIFSQQDKSDQSKYFPADAAFQPPRIKPKQELPTALYVYGVAKSQFFTNKSDNSVNDCSNI